MYYIIYKTINLINNKFYIGMHSTLNLEDGYLGSGKIILSAIRLYGKANFSREILHLCDSEEEMILKEIEIVNEELVKDENCYNLRMGGTGLNSKNASELMLKLWKTEEFKNIMKSKYTEEYNLKLCAIQKEVQNRKEVKDKKSGTMRKKYSNSREIQNKISQSLKKYFSNPENIERLKSNSSNLWKNSEYKNKMSKAISKGQKRLWENNEYKNKMKNIYTERNIPINKEKIRTIHQRIK